MLVERYTMSLKRIQISDNLRLLSINTKKFKTAAMKLSVALPLTKQNFLMSRLLCGVLGRGTQKYSSLEAINKRLDDLYASCVSVNSNTVDDLIIFSISADLLDPRFIPDNTDVSTEVIEVISQMLFYPLLSAGLFPQDKLEHEKTLLIESFESKINDPRLYAASKAEELMRRDDAKFPTLEYIISNTRSITSQELTEFYRYLLLHAPWKCIYVGSESAESIAKKLELLLGDLIGGQSAFHRESFPHLRSFAADAEEMPLAQSRLVIGLCPKSPVNQHQLNSINVANGVFGGGPFSKLFLNVRERLGLCYSCSSSFSQTSKFITVSAGISAENRQQTEAEIFKQLNEIKNGNVSDNELLAVRRSIEYTFDQTYDSPFALISFYSTREHLDIDETPEERKNALLSVSAEDIVDAAGLLNYDFCYFLNGTLGADADGEEV